MKKTLKLCKENVHFTFESRTYVQTDGVAMGSTLGPGLADMFMIKLKNSLLSNLTEPITFWKRCVNDAIYLVKIER